MYQEFSMFQYYSSSSSDVLLFVLINRICIVTNTAITTSNNFIKSISIKNSIDADIVTPRREMVTALFLIEIPFFSL